MVGLPDARGSRCWLGNIQFEASGGYRFEDSKQFPEEVKKQKENFFFQHPKGKVTVRYVVPFTAETLLESVPEGLPVAYLDFTSTDGKHWETFTIKTSHRARSLAFASPKPLSFEMGTAWRNFWR
jgi:hypothetical protein